MIVYTISKCLLAYICCAMVVATPRFRKSSSVLHVQCCAPPDFGFRCSMNSQVWRNDAQFYCSVKAHQSRATLTGSPEWFDTTCLAQSNCPHSSNYCFAFIINELQFTTANLKRTRDTAIQCSWYHDQVYGSSVMLHVLR